MYNTKTNINNNNLDNLTINCLSIIANPLTTNDDDNEYSESFQNNGLKNCKKFQLFYRVSETQLKRLPTGH